MRIALLTSLALVAATAFAQDADTSSKKNVPDAKAWIERLGDDEYVVREEATRKLIKMGAKAVPALEEAVKSADLEVRLRAGRALRAIRGDAERAGSQRERFDEERGKPGQRGPRRERAIRVAPGDSQVEMQITNGKVRVKVTETVDGKRVVKTYEGASVEELKKKYPELRGEIGSFDFRVGGLGLGRNGRDPFDMEHFWKDFWNKDQDLRTEMKEIERLMERFRRANRDAFGRGWKPRVRAGESVRGLLGVRVQRPSRVLAAQLMLRGRGLVIEMIEKGSLADRLGLEKFDVLVALNGRDIRHPGDVKTAIAGVDAGKSVSARVVRKGQIEELKANR